MTTGLDTSGAPPTTAGGGLPSLVGTGLEVPVATGGTRRYINLDAAASTSAMAPALDAVLRALPWYSSVHRGAGFASQASTRFYESARAAVHSFVGAGDEHVVVFVRNTTDAINHLAVSLRLSPGDAVLSTAIEHHGNMLPWRRVAPVITIAPPRSPGALVDAVRHAFATSSQRIAAVAITGASNVTGEVLPVAEVARVAHDNGAIMVVDAAQLAPHRGIDMVATGIDCLALSGHKMYAPFGAGVLVAPRALLAEAEPLLAGGGAVDFVTLHDVLWTAPPERLEAGSPNVLGAVALGAACATLAAVGMDVVADHERRLLRRLEGAIEGIDGLTVHRLWDGPGIDRLGVLTFSVAGRSHALLAAALSAEHAVGVRHGCFCAHPYMAHLLGIDEAGADAIRDRIRAGDHAAVPGAVRASFSIATTDEDVDTFANALRTLVTDGPALRYEADPSTGDFHLAGDPREYPLLDPLPVQTKDVGGGGCGSF